MSSSSYHPLHRVKRPFEEYDSDPHPQPMPTTTTTPTTTYARSKRARSNSSSSSTDDSSSNPSSSSYTTAQSSDFLLLQDAHMSVPSPPTPEDSFRTSLQRFAEFDRQIAALRTSLAAPRSPPPTMDPLWRPSSPLSHATATDPASNVAVAASRTLDSSDVVAVPSATLSFQPSFSNTIHHTPAYRPSPAHQRVGDASSSTTPTLMRPSSIENTTRAPPRSPIPLDTPAPPSHIRHPRRTLSPLVLPPDPSSSSPTSVDIPPRHRTLLDDANARSRRRAADRPSPSLDLEVPSRFEDYLGEQPRLSQSQLRDRVRVIRDHPAEREAVPSVFDVFNIAESSHQERNWPAPPVPRYTSITEPLQPRVPGTHNERPRGPAPITTTTNPSPVSSQDLHPRVHSSWTSIPSSNSLMSESASERRHALALERVRAQHHRSSVDATDEPDSRWSNNSWGEREQENVDPGIVSPVPPSPSVESAPGTGTNLHFPPLGSATGAPGSTTNRTETSISLQRSFSELFAETSAIMREEGPNAWLHDLNAPRAERELERNRERERAGLERQRQREGPWEWERARERQRERTSRDVGRRSFASGSSLPSTSAARDDSSLSPSVLPRPSLSQLGAGSSTTAMHATSATAATMNSNQQYSYSNLNLSSFHSGLFRDSLRRNVEVDQASLSSISGPVMFPLNPRDSRVPSRLDLDDSESEMDLDDFVRTRPPSPEWSRPYPYAGRTPPPDYSPPPRSFNLRPSFGVRRGRIVSVNYESPGRVQQPDRNSTTRPIPPASSGPTRPTYESNNLPSSPERTERDRFHPARFLESFYRPYEDTRRNTATGTSLSYHPNQNHVAVASGPRQERNSAIGAPLGTNGAGNGSEVNRRNSLGGSLRSRLARLANPHGASSSPSSNGTEVASGSGQRSPPRPMGARPQGADPRRRLVAGGSNVPEHASRHRSSSGPIPWAVNNFSGAAESPASVVTPDVPWRAAAPGARNVFVAPPPVRPEMPEVVGRSEEQRSRLRTLRQRLQLDRSNDGVRFRHGMFRGPMGRRGNLGDYVPDELFDDSYEALLSLSSMLGEVRSRVTPEDVIASLSTGTFKEWKKTDSESRCPICLDDYEPSDVLTKLIECTHWLHKNCLEQWLRTANTCPVCREKVRASPKPAPARRRPHRDVPETNSGGNTNRAASGNGLNSRSAQTTPQTNGRPFSFVSMVLDRVMSGDGTAEPLPSPPFVVPPATRDARRTYAVRALQQPHARELPQSATHPLAHPDVFIEFAAPHELPYYMRAPPSTQLGSSSSRPFSFASHDQGSDSSTSTTSSDASMVIDDVGAGHRRSMALGARGGSGPLFFDTPPLPTNPRRDNPFVFVPPPSSAYANDVAVPPHHPIARPHQQHQQPLPTSAEAPTMATSNATESASREWRGPRGGYDALFHLDTSRASSLLVSGTQPRPMSVANRLPVEEDSPFEEDVFGWGVRGRVGASSGQ